VPPWWAPTRRNLGAASLITLAAPSDSESRAHHGLGSTQQSRWPSSLLHRKGYLQGSEIPAVILPSRLVAIKIVTLSPRRLETREQPAGGPLRARGPDSIWCLSHNNTGMTDSSMYCSQLCGVALPGSSAIACSSTAISLRAQNLMPALASVRFPIRTRAGPMLKKIGGPSQLSKKPLFPEIAVRAYCFDALSGSDWQK
jgi:hypothetical protein